MFTASHKTRRAPRTSTTRPVEPLEPRQLFAVTVAPIWPDTLILTGDAANDAINIYDNGSGLIQGSATDAVGGMTPFGPFPNIRRIVVNTGAGSDRVFYNLYGDNLAGGATFLNVDLGDGDDVFQFYAANDIDMGPNAYLDVKVRGGAGKDYLWALYRGELDGQMNINMDGGDGDDRLITDVKFDPGSTGAFLAGSFGGKGNDAIDLLVRKSNPFDPTFINALASGGDDTDQITRTPWAFNDATCEFVSVVP
jgi:hypothetical protein